MPLPRGGAHSSARPWSPEEAAEFAARRDFRFVQLLSTDRAAFRTARRLGMFAVRSTVTRSETHMHKGTCQDRQQRRRVGPTMTTTEARSPEAPLLNSAQRRSARRREAWWQAKLESVSVDTAEASPTHGR